MDEEQKQAIKELKHFTNMTVFWKEKEYTSNEIDNCINIVLHLIDKQQKEIKRKDKVFDDCKYTIIEYVKTAKDTMQKMEAMIEIEKDVINEFDKLLKGE